MLFGDGFVSSIASLSTQLRQIRLQNYEHINSTRFFHPLFVEKSFFPCAQYFPTWHTFLDPHYERRVEVPFFMRLNYYILIQTAADCRALAFVQLKLHCTKYFPRFCNNYLYPYHDFHSFLA